MIVNYTDAATIYRKSGYLVTASSPAKSFYILELNRCQLIFLWYPGCVLYP